MFVTATDLKGVELPIRTDFGVLNEPIYRHVFEFSFRQGGANHFQGTDTPQGGINYDPMLAMAARCTSSFPAAFEPMQLQQMKDAILKADREDWKQSLAHLEDGHWQRFFQPMLEKDGALPLKKSFGDGGILDNKPFDHAITAIGGRMADIPVERKLLYINPFVEMGQGFGEEDADPDEKPMDNIDFVESTMLAGFTLPRFETIRNDLEDIKLRDQRVYRVRVLLANLEEKLDDQKLEANYQKSAGRRFPKSQAVPLGHSLGCPLRHLPRVEGLRCQRQSCPNGHSGCTIR